MKVTVVSLAIGAFNTVTKGSVQGMEDLEIRGRLETIPNYSIVNIDQNTEKSPWDLRRLSVTHIPVKDPQQTLL